jgi:membrane protein DedA with SNARE-associated domain
MESFLTHAGYLALILFGFVEACSIPISSEVTFGFAGVLAYQHHLSLPLVIIIGTIAELAGSYTSYAIGRIGGRPTVQKLGRFVLLTGKDMDRAERFLAGRGSWTVAVGRALPVIRAFVGIVSGLVEIPAVQFGFFNLIGTAVFASALSATGYALGSAWGSISHDISVASYVLVALVVLAFVVFVVYRLREFRRERALGQEAILREDGTPGPSPETPPASPASPGAPASSASPGVPASPGAPAAPASPAGRPAGPRHRARR